MRANKEVMVPFSVIERLNELHYKHLHEITSLVADHLERVAALYERALNPPPLTAHGESTPMWVSEEEEDERFIAMRAEARALEEAAREAGFSAEDFSIE